jgi:putative heme iron utilization protein
MTPEDTASLREILTGQRLLALGLVVEGAPVTGLLPYAVDAARTGLYVQASRLARHSRGLTPGAAWSGVVHVPDAPGQDALQVPRLVLEGVVRPLERGGPEFQAAAQAFTDRFPSAAMTVSLGDFGFYFLEIRDGRLILGFGRALNLAAHHFRDLAAP